MRSRAILGSLIAGVLGFLLLFGVACGGDDDAPATTLIIAHNALPIAMEAEGAAAGGDVGLESMMNTHDFPFQYQYKSVAGGNFIQDTSGFQPGLVETWDVSADGKTITFNIRKGVKSGRGNELTAEDFKWHADRYFGLGQIWAFVYGSVGLKGSDQVVVKDKYTVEYNLAAPNAVFVPTSTIFWNIADSTEVKNHLTPDDEWGRLWFEKNSASFGPYSLALIQEGEQWEFEANPNYWGDTPNNSRVFIRNVPDASVRASLLEAGTVDIAWGLSVDELARLEGKSGVKILSDPTRKIGTELHLVMNTTLPPFDDVRVRQAIAHAIPYDDIIQGVFKGHADRLETLLRPIDIGFSTSGVPRYDFDVEKAKQLLAAAGHADGFSTTVTLNSESAIGELVLIAMKSALADVGIDMGIDKKPASDIGQFSRPRPYAMWLNDSDKSIVPNAMYVYTHFYQPPDVACCNWADYTNDQISAKLAEGVAASSVDEQLRIANDIQKIIMSDLPKVPIVYEIDRLATRDNISGYAWAPWQWLNWATIVKEE